LKSQKKDLSPVTVESSNGGSSFIKLSLRAMRKASGSSEDDVITTPTKSPPKEDCFNSLIREDHDAFGSIIKLKSVSSLR